jgi:hypothetical protein
MTVSTEIDNNFGYEKITQLVDNIPLNKTFHIPKNKYLWNFIFVSSNKQNLWISCLYMFTVCQNGVHPVLKKYWKKTIWFLFIIFTNMLPVLSQESGRSSLNVWGIDFTFMLRFSNWDFGTVLTYMVLFPQKIQLDELLF